MKFLSLKIKNFMSIGKLELQLADRGVILITGRNCDNPASNSNGSGKSSIWDSLIWALYGRVLREDVGADDVMRLKGKGCIVKLKLEDDDGKIWIVRRTRGVKSSPGLDLSCNDINVSGATTATTQEKIHSLLGADFSTFASSVIFGQDTIRFAQLTDKEKKGVLERLLGLELYEKAYKLVSSKISGQKMSIELAHAGFLQSEQAIREKQDRIKQLEEKTAKEDQTLRDLVQEYKKQIKKTKRDGVELQAAVEKAEAREEKVRGIREKLREAQNEASRCKELVQEYFEEEAESRELLRGVKNDRGTPCPTCGKGLDKESRRHTCNVIRKRLRKLDRYIKRTERRYDRTRDLIQTYGELLKKKSGPTNLAEARSAFGRNRERLATLRSNLSNTRGTGNGSRAVIEEIQGEIRKLHKKVSEDGRFIKKQKRLLNKRKYWQQAFSPGGIRSYLMDGIVPFLNKRANYYSQIMTAGHTEIKFTTVTKLRSGSYAEKFSILATNRDGAKVYGGNSAGERQRIDVCVALALKDLARSRNKNRLDLIVFDEAFETLDEAGSERIIQLLNKESQGYGSCFVITHNDSLKQFFTERIEVVKRDGITKLEEA
jgi:DNA repair exonuclease SbcCD ATPase subunit